MKRSQAIGRGTPARRRAAKAARRRRGGRSAAAAWARLSTAHLLAAPYSELHCWYWLELQSAPLAAILLLSRLCLGTAASRMCSLALAAFCKRSEEAIMVL
jgi:hypothetical protein